MLALLAATAFSIAQMRNARQERDAALYANKRADAQIEFQSQLMSQIGNRPITMREILDRGRAVLQREYAGDPRLLAATLVQLSSRYADLGDSKIRGELLARAESLAVANHDESQLIEVQCDKVDNLRTEGRYQEAAQLMERATAMLRAHPDPRAEVGCLQTMTDLTNESGLGHGGSATIRRAIAIRDSLGETKDADYITLFSSLATALDREGQHRDALNVYRRAMAILDRTGQGETMNRAIFEHDYAVSLIDLGETAEAEQRLRDVLDRIARSDPSGHLPTQPLIHYAHTALFDRHTDSAAKYFAILAQQATQDHDSYWEGRALFGLARAQLQLGQLAAFERTTARFRAVTDSFGIKSTDDEVTDPRILDARLALSRGDATTAHRLVVQVLRSNGYVKGTQQRVFPGKLVSTLILAAECALATHDAADALDYARAARTTSTLDSLTETRSARVGAARLVEARALLALGDSADARTSAERALVALRNGAGVEHPRTREAEALLARITR
jgi:tetratricopeptide (TPR) repeat protein